MDDQIVYCRDCNREFAFTVGGQEFYMRHKLTNPPGRCPDCRTARKQNGGVQSGDGEKVQNGNHGRVLYPAICASCNKPTQVPFQPRPGGRPVYCKDCYQLRGTQQPKARW
ncbi:MAG TPA: zinc-ribbon domain containing protein [Ktedonobacteraceae bacterium]